MIMSSSFVSGPMDCHGGIRLSSFILAGVFTANGNVDLPCFGGPWADHQCHSGLTSNYSISMSSEYA